jgi:hypothetical protein
VSIEISQLRRCICVVSGPARIGRADEALRCRTLGRGLDYQEIVKEEWLKQQTADHAEGQPPGTSLVMAQIRSARARFLRDLLRIVSLGNGPYQAEAG